MLQPPLLIIRPIVVTPQGTRLCRPSQVVLDIQLDTQKGDCHRSADDEKLASYPIQNGLAKALREIGPIERTLFMPGSGKYRPLRAVDTALYKK